MKCLKCGNDLEPGVKFCNKCGAIISDEVVPNQMVTTVPPVQVEQEIINKAPKKKRILIIVGLIVLEILLLVGTGFIVYKITSKNNSVECKDSSTLNKDNEEKDDNDSQETEEKKEVSVDGFDFSKIKLNGENDLGKKIELVKAIYDKNNKQLHVLLKNNTGMDIDYSVYLNYLDKNGTRIDRELSLSYTKKDSLMVVYLSCSPEEEFADINLSVSAQKLKSYFTVYDVKDTDLKVTKLDTEFRVDYTNAFNDTMDMQISVIYYKNNEIVDFNRGFISSLKSGSTGSANIYFMYLDGFSYSNPNSSELFDRYDVIANLAYNYTANSDY